MPKGQKKNKRISYVGSRGPGPARRRNTANTRRRKR